jgi:pimeloyl-ACP methyl ester carboxylesterase
MGGEDLMLETEGGALRARLHQAADASSGIVWVFGAGGGLGGPAGGIYERLAARLQPEGISSLQVAYRRPAALKPCVEDTLTGAGFLRSHGTPRVILVGHSFGGAVVINAGVADPRVIAVAALSSQTGHTEAVGKLSPRPLLLMHGEQDEVLSPECSLDLFRRAKEPKRLVLYPGCNHGLDQCRDEIDRDLTDWISETVAHGAGGNA